MFIYTPSTGIVALVFREDPNKVTLVEVPSGGLPQVGKQMTVSPTEVVQGPQPVGQLLTAWVPSRNLIEITAVLGPQKYFGHAVMSYQYTFPSNPL